MSNAQRELDINIINKRKAILICNENNIETMNITVNEDFIEQVTNFPSIGYIITDGGKSETKIRPKKMSIELAKKYI